MIEVIQLLGGGSLLSTPAEEDLRSELWPGIERYFRGAHGVSAEQRVRLLKLAWDATGSAFGQRQMQYERYHSGDPVRLAAAQYTGYDTAPLLRTVQRAMHPAGRQEADGASGADPGEARAPGEVRW
jgi:4-hydroxyphenylacetate 3-monooxygenase/anthranilate 3-monooxygenase (FAD)/4-hydroxyphenylacetate 3-monooxygenase